MREKGSTSQRALKPFETEHLKECPRPHEGCKGHCALWKEATEDTSHSVYVRMYVCLCTTASHTPVMPATGEISFGLALTEEWSRGVDCPEEARSVRPNAAVSARVLYNRGCAAFFLPPPTTLERRLLLRKADFLTLACEEGENHKHLTHKHHAQHE